MLQPDGGSQVSILLSSIKSFRVRLVGGSSYEFQFYLVLLKAIQRGRAPGKRIGFQFYLVLLKARGNEKSKYETHRFNST